MVELPPYDKFQILVDSLDYSISYTLRLTTYLPVHFDYCCPFLDRRMSQNRRGYHGHFPDILPNFDADVDAVQGLVDKILYLD